MGLWVPPGVSRELQETTAQHNAEVREMFWFRGPVCAQWNPELQRLDPYLRLGQAKPDAHAPGVRAGFYHLIRLNPGAPVWVQPITGPDGEFAEPTSSMLDLLRQSDLQNPRAVLARRAADEAAQHAREKDEAQDDVERQEELLDRWKAATQTHVSMSRDVPWSQNVKGRRAA